MFDADDPAQAAMLARALVAVARSGATSEQLGWMALGRADVLGAALTDLARTPGPDRDLSTCTAAARLAGALQAASDRR